MGRNARLGRQGEQVAAAYARRLGWDVLARNWRPADPAMRGELDLVARDGGALVICEVKTRSGTGAGPPAAAVTPRKLARLRRLAGAWLAEQAVAYRTVRIDVLGVLWRPEAVAPTIAHHRDVGR